MPDSRLNSDVFPAPFGPMIPSSSPSLTSSETSATIVAPPMSSPSERVARRCPPEFTRPLLERRHRRLHVPRRDDLDDLGRVAGALLHELNLEHRLDHRVILRPNPLLALGCEELPALERRDHLVDVVAVRLLHGTDDHLRGDEPVRREEVGHLLALLHRLHEPG